MRIGAPPQPKAPQRRKWFGIRPELVIAASVLIAMGGAISAVYVFGPAQSQPIAAESKPGLPVETQVQCANIKHAYTIWSKGLTDLKGIHEMTTTVAKFEVKTLTEDGQTFLDAVSGYQDQAAKELAVRVAEYNYEVSFIALELQARGAFSPESQLKAVNSWTAVDSVYSSFLALTCS